MDEGEGGQLHWEWHDAVLADLGPDLSLATSHTLWEDLTQSEEEMNPLFDSTPTSVMKNAALASDKGDISPHTKRRRMLHFPCEQAQLDCHKPSAESYDDCYIPDFPTNELSCSSPMWYMMDDGSLSPAEVCEDTRALMNIESPVSNCGGTDISGERFGGAGNSESSVMRQRMAKLATPVVYPFDVVKPSGMQGDVTLNDINRRINQKGSNINEFRHQRHRQNIDINNKKEVVALTKIHTEGNGSITIMRTKK